MATRRKAITAEDPKHGETLVFRGLSYRYHAPDREWSLVGFEKPPLGVPTTVATRLVRTTRGLEPYWRADGASGRSPLAALEAWAKSITALRTREAREAERHAKDLWAVVHRLERPSWKPRTPRS